MKTTTDMTALQLFICVVIVQCIVHLAGISAFQVAAFSVDRLGPAHASVEQTDTTKQEETNALPEDSGLKDVAFSSSEVEDILHLLVDVHLDQADHSAAEAVLPAGGVHLDPVPAELAPTTPKPPTEAKPDDLFSIDAYIKASELLDKLQADQPQFDFQPIYDKLNGSPEPEDVKEMITYVRNLREKLMNYIRDTTSTLQRFGMLEFDPPINDAQLANQPSRSIRWQRELSDAMERTKDIIDDFINHLYDIKTQLQMVLMEVGRMAEIPISEVVLKPAPRFRDDRKRQPVSPKPVQTLSEYAEWLVDFLANTIPTANELAVKSFPRFRMVRDAGRATLAAERERFIRSVDGYREFLDFVGDTLEQTMQTVLLFPCLLAAILTVHAVRAQDDCPPDLMSPSCDYFGRWSRGGLVTAHPRPNHRSRRLVHMLMEIAAKQQGKAVKRFAEGEQEGSRSLRERPNLRNVLMGKMF
ncbi:PREDICTED: uncharacterized protein LOC109474301 [Branchiostoma belcheri]|uniref:Uncharacterized protein LOC109474301 n=1 Tax=Branchiostoma belcheri TaxID=7741 RepID=A0A6P4Z0U7_BRABE|nr:PREDICTED: uncharacterized protein LOC109474301 [Branchiostoma belcheri]